MWAVWIENCLPRVFIQDCRVQPTTLRPIVVDGTSLTVVKGTLPRQIPKLPVPVLLEYEEILRKAKALYPRDIRTAQWHFRI